MNFIARPAASAAEAFAAAKAFIAEKASAVTSEEILDVLAEWLHMDFSDYSYSHITISDVSARRLQLIVIAFFIAVCAATYYSLLNRGVFGRFIKSLGAENAFSPETAKTLAEVGYEKNVAVRSAITGGSVYRGVLRCPACDEFNLSAERQRSEYYAAAAAAGKKVRPFRTPRYRYSFETDRFYIPESEAFTAEARFIRRRGTVLTAVVVTVASFAAMILTLKMLPEVLQFADNFIGIFSAS